MKIQDNAGRWAAVLFLCLQMLVVAQISAANPKLPLHFDFGDANSALMPGAVKISPETLYQEKAGFGLLREAEGAFTLDDLNILNEMTIDGVQSQQSIEFKVDIAPGNYWIEIFMEGGRRSLWQGEIRANDTVVADSIFQYGVSFEGEQPPAYWSLLRKVEVTRPSLTLSVSASNQQNSLTGISVYEDNVGPIILKDGKFIVRSELQAPNAALALKLINKGAPAEAQRIIDQIPEEKYGYEKAMLLLALSGRLEVDDPRLYIDLAGKLLELEYATERKNDIALNLRLARLYSEGDALFKMAGWDWAKAYTGEGIFTRLNIAGHKMQKIFEVTNHPLHLRTAFYLGKISFHAWIEQRDKWQKNRANQCFNYVNQYYPDFQLLKVYMGEHIRAGDAISYVAQPGVPEWVNQTNFALKNLRDVIHYWVDYRQAENGEFGGKYDDDVEMLRWWPVARLVLNDPKTLSGMKRLVDGVWNSPWISNGFSSKVRDVEHAAEPVADTQPMMIGLDYGNPVYVERCMESIKGLQDVWTGVNEYGHRHFKSSWYSYDEIDSRPPRDCDVEMNVRTVKAARWLAWYNRHPVAMQFIREWSDAWLEDCRRTDKGKPYGIVPAAIRFKDDAIGGHADSWHHPGMFWDYYDFTGGAKMMRQFLATYQLTGSEKYLEPVEEALKLLVKYYDQDVTSAPIGSEAWVAGIFKQSHEFSEVVELWRLLSDNSEYDDILLKIGSDYLKFRLTGDTKFLAAGSQKIADGILYNRELITTEGYFTDRIDIGIANKIKVRSANHLESMYTGQALHDGFYPFYSITWNGLEENFVAVVIESTPRSVEMLVFNLCPGEKQGLMNFWTLSPGEYEFVQGPDADNDGDLDRIMVQNNFSVSKRSASHLISLPPKSLQRVKIRQLKPTTKQPSYKLTDLAITDSEVHIRKSDDRGTIFITIPVHNIGTLDAHDVNVDLILTSGNKQQTISRKLIKKLEAPLDLEPRVVSIEFQIKPETIASGQMMIHVDPAHQISEITELNNQVNIMF